MSETRTDILLIATGEYSDYSNAAFKVLKPFSFAESLARFKAEWKPENAWDRATGDALVGWLTKEGFIEDLDVHEVHVGSYGEAKVSADQAALRFAPASA